MSEIFGPSITGLEAAMRFRVSRQAALSANVVNADTPGYRRVDLAFEGVLEEAGLRLARTHGSHLGSHGAGSDQVKVEQGKRGTRPDGNGVDLQRELVELTRNAGAFEDQATVLSRLLNLRRQALTDPGR